MRDKGRRPWDAKLIDRMSRRTYERPPPGLWLVGIPSLALMLAGSMLTSYETQPTLAAVLSGIGTLGMFTCAWIVRRHRS